MRSRFDWIHCSAAGEAVRCRNERDGSAAFRFLTWNPPRESPPGRSPAPRPASRSIAPSTAHSSRSFSRYLRRGTRSDTTFQVFGRVGRAGRSRARLAMAGQRVLSLFPKREGDENFPRPNIHGARRCAKECPSARKATILPIEERRERRKSQTQKGLLPWVFFALEHGRGSGEREVSLPLAALGVLLFAFLLLGKHLRKKRERSVFFVTMSPFVPSCLLCFISIRLAAGWEELRTPSQ